jgi:hypothetical protein
MVESLPVDYSKNIGYRYRCCLEHLGRLAPNLGN